MLIDLLLRSIDTLPTFTVLQIGALSPTGDDAREEPYMDFPDRFRGSRVIVCDPDEALCADRNRAREHGETTEYYPVAIGEPGTSEFHLTESPAWNSVYKPNDAFLRRYQNMNAALPVSTATVDTQGMNGFLKDIGVNRVDYIKVNLPWTGQSLLQTGSAVLKQVLGLKVGVALVPLYEKQELFGDICASLSHEGIGFQRFFELYGRTFNPVELNQDPNYATHHLWADALFLTDIGNLKKMAPEQLLKLAVFSDLYESRDVAMLCLMEYDIRHNTSYGKAYAGML